jgi:hypothetical protein
MSDTTSTVNLFFSVIPSCQYVFKSGKIASFVSGRYSTHIASEVEELNAEIAAGHPHLFVKKGEEKVLVADLDPVSALRKKFFAEFQAAQAAAIDPENDMGSSSTATTGMQTSKTIGTITAGSKSK